MFYTSTKTIKVPTTQLLFTITATTQFLSVPTFVKALLSPAIRPCHIAKWQNVK
jgi:hypothetical protein